MKSFNFALPLALVLFVLLTSGVSAEEEVAPERERIEWCDIWFTDADKDALPRVLMIGDSITRGYFSETEKRLLEKAYCGRYTTSRSVCDPVFFRELSLVLGQYDFAVVHFNHGLHGWAYDEEAYAKGFEKLLDALEEEAPGARLVCALSTPVLEKGGMADQRERVKVRNDIVQELCDERGIAINDLYEVSNDEDLFSSDGVHFGGKGRVKQAEAVAGAIGEQLRN